MQQPGRLFFFCGKMGAGKSTRSTLLAADYNAVRISEDEWLAAHYPGQIQTFDEYLALSKTIKPFVKGHVQQILLSGVHVVMDFPANTKAQRAWFKTLCAEVNCAHQLIFLDLTDEQCLSQLAKRRLEQPQRAHFDNAQVFAHVSSFFEPPQDDEQLNILHVANSSVQHA